MDALKDTYIKIIDGLQVDEPAVEHITKFIETYDGKNISEFNLLILSLIQLLKEHKITKIKATGYENIAITKQKYQKILDDLKREYKVSIETPMSVSVPVSRNTLTKEQIEELEKDLDGFDEGTEEESATEEQSAKENTPE